MAFAADRIDSVLMARAGSSELSATPGLQREAKRPNQVARRKQLDLSCQNGLSGFQEN